VIMKSKVGMKITISENGPYRVEGSVPLAKQTIVTNDDGDSVEWRQSDEFETKVTYNLCRCGQSASQPFCDASHTRVGFDGTETASRVPYLQEADVQSGPTLKMTDLPSLCADARFCDANGTAWQLVKREDSEAAVLTTRQAQMCPSGRLVAWDRETNVALEPTFEPSIRLVNDPSQGLAGPLWVREGIPIFSADGEDYEIRNRVTLCRCGASGNKPFCDGNHVKIGFTG
jgi:CDGSH-type Zn-finger protein